MQAGKPYCRYDRELCYDPPVALQQPLIEKQWNYEMPSSIMQSLGRKEAQEVQVEVKLDAALTEPKVIILTNRMTDEVNALIQMLSETEPKLITGFREDTAAVLDEKDILRIYAANGKVFAVLPSGEYTLRLRLYEIEERLKQQYFVRISNSEIINLKKVKSFDLSFTGTICVVFSDGSKTYASRRYVTKLKGVLGL